jgi:predicted nucleotidyltransferase
VKQVPKIIAGNKFKNRILSAIEIASKSGYAISLDEISLLLIDKIDTTEIQKNIENNKQLYELFTIENDLIVLKGYERLFAERTSRDQVSKRLLETAKVFVNQVVHHCPHLKLIGVCGSIAYNSAVKSDDIDIFLVSKKKRLWISILKILILARASSLKAFIERKKVTICLSYAINEEQFEKEMKTRRNSLFAREFLSIHVLAGLTYYKKTLEKNTWIKNMFPRLYDFKLLEFQLKKNEMPLTTKSNVIGNVSNFGIYKILRIYLLLKAFMLNLSYKKLHRFRDLFEAMITKKSLVYTSEKYREIEKMYDTFEN